MENQKFISLVDEVIRMNVSDLHFTSETYPYIRNKIGNIVPVESYGTVSGFELENICEFFLGRRFDERSIDVSYSQ